MTKRRPYTLEQMKCTAKRPHASRRQAIIAADRIGSEHAVPLSVYRCPHCKQWHLTKAKPRQWRQGAAV